MRKKKLYFGLKLVFNYDEESTQQSYMPQVYLIHKRYLDNDGSIWLIPDLDPMPVKMLKNVKKEYVNEFMYQDPIPKKLYTYVSKLKNTKSDDPPYYYRNEFRLGNIPIMNTGNKEHILKPTKNVIDSSDCYKIYKQYKYVLDIGFRFADYIYFKNYIQPYKDKLSEQDIMHWKQYFDNDLTSLDINEIYTIIRNLQLNN